MLSSKSVIFVLVWIVSLITKGEAVKWEAVVGEESPGVRILSELPDCWFSPVQSYVKSVPSVTHTGIKRDPYDRIVEYYATGTGNGHPVETHVYNATYHFSQVTGFREQRYYPESGNSYEILVSGATYDDWDRVLAGYGVTVTSVIYVDANATRQNNGSSWKDAYNFLQDALADAKTSEKPIEIRVARGVYTPDKSSAEPNGTGSRLVSFELINRVAMKGGYAGPDVNDVNGAPINPNTRDIGLFETILSGDLDGNDVPVSDPCDLLWEPTRGENSYHVVTATETDQTSVLDGFVIKGGNADGPSEDLQGGGGMDNSSASPTVTNCTFRDNSAGTSGGGMHNRYTRTFWPSRPNLVNCTFNGNSAGASGGGICNSGWGPSTLSNCTFRRNSASTSGGGMYNVDSSPTLTDCTFNGNSAGISGGGMDNDRSSPTVTNCTFSENTAGADGAGMHNQSPYLLSPSRPILVNCMFSGNSAGTSGGGICNSGWGPPTLSNCTFSGNWAGARGGGMYNFEYGVSSTLSNCTFSGNSADEGGGMYNFQTSPTLTSCTFSGNSADANGAGMYNQSTNMSSRSSPNLTNCAFSGNSSGASGGGTYTSGYGSLTLSNCTFSGNRADNGDALACGSGGTAVLSDCIVWDGRDIVYTADESAITITYSDVQFGWPGEGNIDADPCFADPGYWDPNGTPDDPNDDFWVDGEYHLRSQAGRWDPNSETWVQDDVTSPCVDAGNPCSSVGEEPDPNGGVVNMGAYGGTVKASKSLRPVPECFPSTYSTYNDWKALGEPCCWCRVYQCDGDADGGTETFFNYRIYGYDLGWIVNNWKRKIDHPELDPCADIDHKAETFFKFRVYGKDLATVVTNWKKKDADLAGDCPRPE